MTDDKPKKAIRGYISEYLRQPVRSLREVQQQQEAAQPDSDAGKEPQQREG